MERQDIIDINITDEMQKSYIDYSMSVIVSRALPDVRDGLKPVHRRILYSMYDLKLTSDKAHRKSATIVGDVLGKYHPHGDSSVYNSMVRLAQDFSTRYMLVDGHGNFGSIDGDSAAAHRYTEARMSKIAEEMLLDIDKDTVDFYPNYDETTTQPSVLPSRFPNLLVNGSTGIAVGMTTNIPPHNLGEVLDACEMLIDKPESTIDDLLEVIKGPDFPTGALVMGNNRMLEAYRSGHGAVKVRAKAEIEERSKDRFRIVIKEIPYMINKTKMLEDIAKLVREKKIDGITELRDESNRHGIRIVFEIRRDANPNVILNQLYKYSSLQSTISMIFIALDNGQPVVFNIKQLLEKYIEHQKDVETRRVKYDLDKAIKRAHILEGLIKALDNIDEIIKIIRNSYDDAKQRLMETFDFSDVQAQSILDMRLRRLQGLEYDKLSSELEALRKDIEYYNAVLSDESMLMDIIKGHFKRIKEKYGDERRTEISVDTSEIDIEDLIEEKEMVITMTEHGYIKRMAQDVYQSQNRGGKGITALSTKDEDTVYDIFNASTHDTILFFTSKGRLYNVKTYRIPESSRQSKGTPLVNLIELDSDERVTSVIPIRDFEGFYVMLLTKNGLVNKFKIEDLKTNRSGGIYVVRLDEGDEVMVAKKLNKGDDILISTRNGKAIRFDESAVRATGRNTRGVNAIKLSNTDKVVSMSIISGEGYVLSITENGFGKRTKISEYRNQARAGKGVINYRVNKKTGNVVSTIFVNEYDEIMIINSNDIIIRIRVSDISAVGRSTSGVNVMRVDGESKVVSTSKIFSIEGREDGTQD